MDPLVTLPLVATLAAVAGAAVGRRREKKRRAREALQKVDIPGTQKDAALLIALGFEPHRARIVPVLRPVRGLRIVDLQGQPLGFWTQRCLRKPEVRRAWREALASISVRPAP